MMDEEVGGSPGGGREMIVDRMRKEWEMYEAKVQRTTRQFEKLRARTGDQERRHTTRSGKFSPGGMTFVSSASYQRSFNTASCVSSPRASYVDEEEEDEDELGRDDLISTIGSLRKELVMSSHLLKREMLKTDMDLVPSKTRTNINTTTNSKANEFDKETLDGRIAQLEEEEALVKAQLAKLRRSDEGHGKGKGKQLSKEIEKTVSIEEPLVLTTDDEYYEGLVDEANILLSPVLTEYLRLAKFLKEGTWMEMVLQRIEELEQGHRNRHICCKCFVYINADISKLCWTLKYELRSGMSKEEWDNQNTFSVPLKQIGAIFCGGKHEGRYMNCDPDCIFRVHFKSPIYQNLQFAAPSALDCQNWSIGLGLFQLA